MENSPIKNRQTEHHDHHYHSANVGPEPYAGDNQISRYLAERPLRTALRIVGQDIQGTSILCVCAGTGEEALFLRRLGAEVVATDISREACNIIQRRDPTIRVAVEDAEALSFGDASFDYVLVKDGLHHLPRPLLGLYEMIRVARRGVLVLEAHDSWMMRALRMMGFIHDIEESGNYVYRFTRREIHKLSRSMFLQDVHIHTEWYQFIPFLEQRIYPRLNSPLGFSVFKTVLWFTNMLIGCWGNNFILVMKKKT